MLINSVVDHFSNLLKSLLFLQLKSKLGQTHTIRTILLLKFQTITGTSLIANYSQITNKEQDLFHHFTLLKVEEVVANDHKDLV